MQPDEKKPDQVEGQDTSVKPDFGSGSDESTAATQAANQATTDTPAPEASVVPADSTPETPGGVVVSGGDAPKSSTEASSPVVPAFGGSTTANGSGKRGRKWLWPIVIVVIIILLAIGYVFAIYLPNTPGSVYKSSLNNTGKAVDKLVAYEKGESAAHYKSVAFTGSATVKSAAASFDASLNGTFDSSANGTAQIKADIVGQHVTANVRSIKAAGSSDPDLYVQVSGVKSLLSAYGLGSLDGQWIAIDHTLLDSAARNYTNGANPAKVPTLDQLNDALAKVQAVNKQYLFTTDSSKAVLTDQKFIGKENQNGRSVDHYKVSYNKAHLEAYVDAVKSALDSSSLNDWSKQANSGKNLSQVIDFSSLQNTLKTASTNYSFDLWADVKTKLVSSIKFTDPKDSSSSFTVGQSYTGGDTYPLWLSVGSKDGNGKLNLSVNTKSHTYTFDVTANDHSSSNTSVTFHATLTPGNNPVKVTAPSGAMPITTLLAQYESAMLGGTAAGVPTQQGL